MNAVENGGALLFGWSGIAFTNFAGESAIDNGNSGATVTCKQFGDADGKDRAVELVKRTLDVISGSVENFVSGDDIAVSLVVVLLDDFKGVVVKKLVSAFFGEFEDSSGLFVVEFDANFGRANLNVKPFENFRGRFTGLKNFFKEGCVVSVHLIYSFLENWDVLVHYVRVGRQRLLLDAWQLTIFFIGDVVDFSVSQFYYQSSRRGRRNRERRNN